ncbi:MAG: hypothetical protein AAF847_06915 [Bacteroidota bacterium]
MTSYSNFTLSQIREQFNIANKRSSLFPNIQALPPLDSLQKALKTARELPLKSKKARSEMIVVPILLDIRERNSNFFTIYSGDHLNADEAKGLRGECDFMLARDTGSFEVNTPILQIVEAKKSDIEMGIPQCAAQMLGASVYNEKEGHPMNRIYGCVTTGDIWQFMLLENNEIHIDIEKYYLGNLEELIGVFQQIMDYFKTLPI